MDISKFLTDTKLEASSGRPLYLQTAEIVTDLIINYVLPAGTKLPPERELAELLGISRTTAINAYRRLEQQGLVITRVGSGTYVAEPAKEKGSTTTEIPWPQLFAAYPQTPFSSILRELVSTPAAADNISFAVGMPDPDLYPVDIFTDLTRKNMNLINRSDLSYIPTEGYAPLRRSAAKMLTKKGILVTTDNIIILSGAQQGLYLLSKVLLEPGDYVVTEAPTFVGAIQAFQAAGARMLSLPVAENFPLSVLEDYLIRYRPKMLYLMPTYQNPSGRTISEGERRALLELAVRHRLVIVEDDPYSELYYGELPPPALKALDPYGGVIYLGTFSKNLVPGLRTGYIVGHPALINRLALDKQYLDLHSNNFSQWLINEFLEHGHLDNHLALVRGEYKKRRDTAIKALRRFCGSAIDFECPDGGYYLWCRMKPPGTARRLLHEAVKSGVSFVPGEAFYTAPSQYNEFRICFTGQGENLLTEGIRRLGQALEQIKDSKRGGTSRLFTPAPPIV